MPEAMNLAAQTADIVELRLDGLGDLDAAARFLATDWKKINCPAILTLRDPAQGGRSAALTFEDRKRFWSSGNKIPADTYVDLEIDLVADYMANGQAPFDWRQVICSHHDFVGSQNPGPVFERLTATPAGIIKLAVQANDAAGCIPILNLLERARRAGRDMIAIAMGDAGLMTRILGPAYGSFLTYGSSDEEKKTAPGQKTAREMRDLYRIDSVTRETAVFGIIGSPVMQSMSPRIHNAAFAEIGFDAVYIPFEVHNATEFMRRMARPRSRELNWNLRGLSVTAPHKMTVMEHLDWIEPAAKQMRAVNTIVVRGDELHGYNTDVIGFISPLRQRFGSLAGVRCAVIGAGGAARAVLWALNQEDASVSVFSRDPAKAESVARQFNAESKSLSEADLSSFEIVINATPLGMRGKNQDETPATLPQLRGVRLAYDLVYNPPETRFLAEARAAGCDTLGGLEMLLAQAFQQFKLWTGKQPNRETMRAAASQALR